MQRKLAVAVYNCMTGIASTLKPHDYIRPSSLCICNFTFPFVSPVCTHNCFYHIPCTYHSLNRSCVATRIVNIRTAYSLSSFPHYSLLDTLAFIISKMQKMKRELH